MRYVKVWQYKLVNGVDQLNRATVDGWQFVSVAHSWLGHAEYLVRKIAKRRVSEASDA